MKKIFLLSVPVLLLSLLGFAWVNSLDNSEVASFQSKVDQMVTQTLDRQTVEALPTWQPVTQTAEMLLSVTTTPTATATSTPVPVKYTFLREWKVAGAPKGYGADILVEEDVLPEELIRFVLNMSGEQDPVTIRIWTDLALFQQKEAVKGPIKDGYILIYTRQTVAGGALSDINEIQWLQEEGNFSEFYGQTIQIMDEE